MVHNRVTSEHNEQMELLYIRHASLLKDALQNKSLWWSDQDIHRTINDRNRIRTQPKESLPEFNIQIFEARRITAPEQSRMDSSLGIGSRIVAKQVVDHSISEMYLWSLSLIR